SITGLHLDVKSSYIHYGSLAMSFVSAYALETLMDENSTDEEIEKELAPIAGPCTAAVMKQTKGHELADALPQMFPSSVTHVLLQAAVFMKENKAGKAEEMLGKIFMRSPGIQHFPATVATLVSLKERSGGINGAGDVLDSAINYWLNAMTEDNKLSVIMQEAAAFKLKHDVEKAKTYEKQLKPLPGLACVNVNALEKTSGEKHVENGITWGTPLNLKKQKARIYLRGRESQSTRKDLTQLTLVHHRIQSGGYLEERVAKEAANNVNAKSSQPSSSKGSSSSAPAVQPKPSLKSSKKKSRKPGIFIIIYLLLKASSKVNQEWTRLPRGVKFDPLDHEIIWHLLTKSGASGFQTHSFIDEFIPTVVKDDGISYKTSSKVTRCKHIKGCLDVFRSLITATSSDYNQF
ncbi:hypothetical protein Tco_1346468, partial [Tanacetum coccineum]